MSTTPVKVAVTGAAGQLGHSLLSRIASGSLFGPATPVVPAARDRKVRVLGPAPAAMARRAGRHRAQLLVESPLRSALQAFLADWVEELVKLRVPRSLRWSLDVDPAEVD